MLRNVRFRLVLFRCNTILFSKVTTCTRCFVERVTALTMLMESSRAVETDGGSETTSIVGVLQQIVHQRNGRRCAVPTVSALKATVTHYYTSPIGRGRIELSKCDVTCLSLARALCCCSSFSRTTLQTLFTQNKMASSESNGSSLEALKLVNFLLQNK